MLLCLCVISSCIAYMGMGCEAYFTNEEREIGVVVEEGGKRVVKNKPLQLFK